jgi:large subunit ribosomal protein L21
MRGQRGLIMYAVIRTGGKQYRVIPGEKLKVEKLAGDVGSDITIDKVLMIADGDDVTIGVPLIAGATVPATVISHGRGDKVMIFKFRRRKHYRKTQGHRQSYTEIQIGDFGGKTASKPAKAAKAEAAPAESVAVKETKPAKTAAKPAKTAAPAKAAKAAKPAAKKE